MNTTPDRAVELRQFVKSRLGRQDLHVERASADASFRSYWRVSAQSEAPGRPATWVVMDAPPDKEDLAPWLDIGTRLRDAGLHAPEVFAVDAGQGFILMEDLGARTYLPELNNQSADALYADALDALSRMQREVKVDGLPHYDRQRLIDEMQLLPTWFLDRHLGYQTTAADANIIEAAFSFLAESAEEQPSAFVHRDYHSRNLLLMSRTESDGGSPLLENPAIVDFQDAVIGPITYDLVSLLRDCYIEWDHEHVNGWVESYRMRLLSSHQIGPEIDTTRFMRWFDLIGLQRHIKVLGIFCRLWYRDGKNQYLDDLPLVWRYTTEVAGRYPELTDFLELLERAMGDRNIRAVRETPAT
ncbi:aminoglycoside phosphotransferase family protein [Dokdonella sp.]|uniref:aminoglycoside phosphotransferase family protein n=1 Tax=Dokdonella sp. TaxID=2291710 RepID=UPI003C653459